MHDSLEIIVMFNPKNVSLKHKSIANLLFLFKQSCYIRKLTKKKKKNPCHKLLPFMLSEVMITEQNSYSILINSQELTQQLQHKQNL